MEWSEFVQYIIDKVITSSIQAQSTQNTATSNPSRNEESNEIS